MAAGYWPSSFWRVYGRRRNFPFRKQAMPFSQHLENFLTLNKFVSTKVKKKGNCK